ncbi:hypothetical protein ACFLXH_05845 [Chloroflexota bacterium]
MKKVIANERNTPFYYVDMFYQKYRECVLQISVVEWSKLRHPIESQKDFIETCIGDNYKFLPPEPALEVFNVLAIAQKHMFEHFRSELNKKGK